MGGRLTLVPPCAGAEQDRSRLVLQEPCVSGFQPMKDDQVDWMSSSPFQPSSDPGPLRDQQPSATAPSPHSGFSREEGITVNLEPSRILLATGTLEGVNRRSDPYIDKAGFFEHLLPGCTRQTTGNSSCPKIDVVDCRRRHRLPVRDIRKLENAARPQHAMDLGEHGAFVGAEIDNPVADHDIGPAVIDRQRFRQPFAKLDIMHPERGGCGS
jgi:hypothetical protein